MKVSNSFISEKIAMVKKNKILIISDDLNESSKALQRALSAIFEKQYYYESITYNKALLEIHEKIIDSYEKEFIHEIEKIQDNLKATLDKKLQDDKAVAWGDWDTTIQEISTVRLSLQNEIAIIQEKLARAYESGISLPKKVIDHIEELNKTVSDLESRETEEIDEFGAQDKTLEQKKLQTLTMYIKESHSLIHEYKKQLLEIPDGAHTLFLEQFLMDLQEKRGKGLAKLLQLLLQLSQGSDENLPYLQPLDRHIRDVVSAFLNGISLTIIVDVTARSDDIKGIKFLRKYWAEMVKLESIPPPVIFIALYDLQELVRRDWRHLVLNIEGVEVVTLPFSLNNLEKRIRKNVNKLLSTDMVRDYLRISSDLVSLGIIEHAWRNFAAPYSLLKGANYVDDIDNISYRNLLRKLQDKSKEAWEEVSIYDALSGRLKEKEFSKSLSESEKIPLSKILQEKRVLIIDDEATNAGLKDTMQVLAPTAKLEVIDGEWDTGEQLCNDERITELLLSPKCIDEYDLILLDLYLTKEDAQLKKQYLHSKPPQDFGGIRILKKIRENEENHSIPVIMFTATTRAFNIQDAKNLEIEGYIQKKACYHDIEEAVSYYLEFKDIIAKSTCIERTLLRYIWKCIQIYKSSPTKSDEIIQYLESAFFSLKGYLCENHYPYLVASLVMVGSVVEKLKRDEVNNPYKVFRAITSSTSFSIEDLYFFMVYSIRGVAAHPGRTNIKLDDAFFAFFALLKALQVNIDFTWNDPYPMWEFTPAVAEEIIKSICQTICPTTSGSLCKDLAGNPCSPSLDTPLKKAMFLSFFRNLQTQESLNNHAIFLFLYYLLCNKKLGQDVPSIFLHLIKSRLTHGGKFCPPFKDNRWVGIKTDDECIDSPLGILKPGMYRDEIIEGDKVLFHPTEKYLRS